MRISRKMDAQVVPVDPANATGSVRFNRMFHAEPPGRAEGAIATFEPGARSAWHSHPLGQTLVILEGSGRVQSWGGPVEEIRAGDVVWTPASEKHWHGASPTEGMVQLAVGEAVPGKPTSDWMEKVSDEEYSSGRRTPEAPRKKRSP